MSKPELNLICFRGEPNYIQETEFDEWNKNLQNHLINETDFFISLPRYKDDLWLRTVLLNPFLTEEYIDSLFKEIDIFDEKYKNQT